MLSSAASCPLAGSPPAPNPRDTVAPSETMFAPRPSKTLQSLVVAVDGPIFHAFNFVVEHAIDLMIGKYMCKYDATGDGRHINRMSEKKWS